MKKFKKAIGVAMAVCLVFSVTGCGSKGNSESAATGTQSGGAATAESSGSAENGEKTVINFWHTWSGSEADALQAVIDDYNSSQSAVKVEVLASQTEDKMLTAIPSGDGPDLVYTADTTCSKWADAGMLAPIDDYIAGKGLDVSNIYESVYKLGNYDGVQYGMPYTMDSYMLFYNKAVLEELNAEPPKTLEELADLSKRAVLKDDSGDYTRLGYVPDYPWIDRVEMPYLFGAEFYDFDSNQVTCTSREFKDAIAYKAGYYTDYGIDAVTKFKSGFGTYASADNPFFQGKVVFAIEGEWFENFIDQYAPKDFTWGAVEVPVTESKPELAGSGRLQGGMLSVSATSKNAEKAFDVINYLTSDEAYIKFCAAKGSLPTTYSALKSEELASQAPQLKGFIDTVLAGKAKAFPAVPFSSEYSDGQGLAEEAVYSGDKTVEEAMQDLYDELQPLADKWVNGN